MDNLTHSLRFNWVSKWQMAIRFNLLHLYSEILVKAMAKYGRSIAPFKTADHRLLNLLAGSRVSISSQSYFCDAPMTLSEAAYGKINSNPLAFFFLPRVVFLPFHLLLNWYNVIFFNLKLICMSHKRPKFVTSVAWLWTNEENMSSYRMIHTTRAVWFQNAIQVNFRESLVSA